MANQNAPTIKSEELNALPEFPVKDTTGTVIYIRYDAKTETGYLLDKNHKYTGRARHIPKSNIYPPEAPPQTTDTDSRKEARKAAAEDNPGSKRKGSLLNSVKERLADIRDKLSSRNKEQDGTDDIEARNRYRLGFLFIAVAVLGLILYGLVIGGVFGGSDSETTDVPAAIVQTEDTGPAGTVNLMDLAAGEQFEVLVVTRNMFRGEKISENDLSSCVISKSEYAACGGAYTLDCKAAVIGMEITRFTPFGSLLLYDGVGRDTDYSKSPYASLSETQVYLDVAIDGSLATFSNILPGDFVAAKISVVTTQEARSPSDKTSKDGMEHSSTVSASMITDTFRFRNIQVADLLASDGSSIYSRLSGLYDVPEPFVPSVLRAGYDKETIGLFVPAYVRFVVTAEQAEEIGTFSMDAASLETTLQRRLDNPIIPDYRARTLFLAEQIEARINEIAAEAKEG